MDAKQATDLLDLFAEDVAVEWPQSGERFHGKEACINIFTNYPGGSPRYMGTPRVLGEGSVWVGEAELMYPGEKKYMVVSIFEIRDGRIVHEIDYFAEPFPAPEWRKQWLPAD